MGSDRPDQPEFQLANGCLADQLIGQYLADIAGLGPLLAPANIRKTLESICKYNYRAQLFDHDSVQRVYALNDEAGAAGLRLHARAAGRRCRSPTTQEAWTGIEYLVAAQFIQRGHAARGRGAPSKMSDAASTASGAIRGTSRNAATTTRARCRPGRA